MANYYRQKDATETIKQYRAIKQMERMKQKEEQQKEEQKEKKSNINLYGIISVAILIALFVLGLWVFIPIYIIIAWSTGHISMNKGRK